MVDPVWTSDGHAYERAAIEQWLASSSTSPQTGSQLVDKRVTTAWAIKKAIEEWTHATGAAAAPGKTAPGKTAADPANTAAAETATKATPKAEAAPWLSLSMVSLLVVMFAATVKVGDVPQVFPVWDTLLASAWPASFSGLQDQLQHQRADEIFLRVKRDWLKIPLSEADIAAADAAAVQEAISAPRVGRGGIDRSVPANRVESGAGRQDNLQDSRSPSVRRPLQAGFSSTTVRRTPVKTAAALERGAAEDVVAGSASTGRPHAAPSPPLQAGFSSTTIRRKSKTAAALEREAAEDVVAGSSSTGRPHAPSPPLQAGFSSTTIRRKSKTAAALEREAAEDVVAGSLRAGQAEYSGKPDHGGPTFFKRSGRRATDEEIQQRVVEEVQRSNAQQQNKAAGADSGYSGQAYRGGAMFFRRNGPRR